MSPNWFEDAKDQVIEARDQGHGHRANVLQTLACPWCGEELRAERDLHIDDDRRRILLYCPRGEGDACPFSRRVASNEGLPILTVDEEIYRYAPSLVIATVDKLAQLPGRATPASCSDVPAATATGTASATTTWTRRPGARASTTRRAHSPR